MCSFERCTEAHVHWSSPQALTTTAGWCVSQTSSVQWLRSNVQSPGLSQCRMISRSSCSKRRRFSVKSSLPSVSAMLIWMRRWSRSSRSASSRGPLCFCFLATRVSLLPECSGMARKRVRSGQSSAQSLDQVAMRCGGLCSRFRMRLARHRSPRSPSPRFGFVLESRF